MSDLGYRQEWLWCRGHPWVNSVDSVPTDVKKSVDSVHTDVKTFTHLYVLYKSKNLFFL